MKLPSFLSHPLIAFAFFLPFALLGNPMAGAAAGAFYYLGREGAEAQAADPRPKAKDQLLPFTPWAWPRQMILDAAVPAAVVILLAAVFLWRL
jgi:hypothetical protein